MAHPASAAHEGDGIRRREPASVPIERILPSVFALATACFVDCPFIHPLPHTTASTERRGARCPVAGASARSALAAIRKWLARRTHTSDSRAVGPTAFARFHHRCRQH